MRMVSREPMTSREATREKLREKTDISSNKENLREN